jgi:polar amino acid transport system substrate-binding protein
MLKWFRPLLKMLVVAGGCLLAGNAVAQQSEGLWASVQKSGTLRCGAAQTPPYIIKDVATGEYSGYWVALCREFAEVLKVKPEFIDTTWDNMIAGLQAGKWDLAPSLTMTPQRALAITFSAPVATTETTLVYNKDNPKFSTKPKSIADVDQTGMVIAVTSGTAQEKSATEVIKNATLMRLPSPDEIRLALMSKRADAVLDTSTSNEIFAAAHPDWAVLMYPVPAINKRGASFGLRRDTSPADLQVLNIFIEDMKTTGRVDQLIQEAIQQSVKK